MKKAAALFALVFITPIGYSAPVRTHLPATVHGKPKLILAIAINQLRYDYATRFRDRYEKAGSHSERVLLMLSSEFQAHSQQSST